MGLKEEISAKRSSIHTDDYSMSIGELINIYRDRELDIHPEFQQFFRWSDEQKSRLIESLLLGIPIPSIFVAQQENGVWDVIDGLQRLSTIFQFVGELKDEKGEKITPLTLRPTKYLPSLEGKIWCDEEQSTDCLDREQQLLIKRSKLDVKIILRESDESSKYELFQRLNSGGSPLSDQELRNCVLIMANPELYRWLLELSQDANFNSCIALTDRAMDEQYNLELIVRFLVFRKIGEADLVNIGDLGEFLNDNIVALAQSQTYDREHEEAAFRFTMKQLAETLEDNSFRRFVPTKDRFNGGFLISAFEVMAIGLGNNYENYANGTPLPDLKGKAKQLWSEPVFLEAVGRGINASRRVRVIIPYGRNYFMP